MNNYLTEYCPLAVRKQTPLGRAYYDPNDDSKHPFLALSVTTILGLVLNKGGGFDQWLKTNGRFSDWIRDYKAHLGTAVHILAEDLFNGEEITPSHILKVIQQHLTYRDIREGGGQAVVDRTVRLYLESLLAFCSDNEYETYSTEVELFDSSTPYAGTVDWVGELNGVPSIVDFKTGTEVSSHDYQLVAYAMLHNYMFPSNKVEKIYTLYLKGAYRLKPTYKLKEVKWTDALENDWRRILKLALSIHGKNGAWKFAKRFEPRESFKLTKGVMNNG
jgi:hypothetical protein